MLVGREVPELWEVNSITPLFNQTIVEGPHTGNVSSISLPLEWHQLPTNLSHVSPSGMSSVLTSRVLSTAHVSPTAIDETSATTTTTFSAAQPPLATAQQTTTDTPQTSQTTAERPRTTQRATTQQITQRLTTQTPITEKTTTVSHPITTSTQPTTNLQVTAVSVSAAAAPATKPVTFPPAISLIQLTAATHRPQTTTTTTTIHHTTSTVHPTRPATAVSRRTTTPSKSVETEKAGCPWRRRELTDDSVSGSTTTVGAHKLQPCVLELCKFFSQCLCRPFSHKTRMKRYCDDSHLWYEKHTSEVCRRVRRISFSRNLKQRCLTKMCDKL